MDLVQKSLSVDFHQDKLTLVEYNGQPYVAMKPLVENMGLDWRSQQRKLTAKRWGMVKMTIPTNGDLQKILQSRILGFALKSISCKTELGYNNLRDFIVVFGTIKLSRNSQY